MPDQSPPRAKTGIASPVVLAAADNLCDECERAIREGRIDARSPIGDATLSYREVRHDPLYDGERLVRVDDVLDALRSIQPGQTNLPGWEDATSFIRRRFDA